MRQKKHVVGLRLGPGRLKLPELKGIGILVNLTATAMGLSRFREAFFLWRVNKLDFVVWVTAFVIVVFAGVEAGLASAVGLSLLIVLWKVRLLCSLPSPPSFCTCTSPDNVCSCLLSELLMHTCVGVNRV